MQLIFKNFNLGTMYVVVENFSNFISLCLRFNVNEYCTKENKSLTDLKNLNHNGYTKDS